MREKEIFWVEDGRMTVTVQTAETTLSGMRRSEPVAEWQVQAPLLATTKSLSTDCLLTSTEYGYDSTEKACYWPVVGDDHISSKFLSFVDRLSQPNFLGLRQT